MLMPNRCRTGWPYGWPSIEYLVIITYLSRDIEHKALSLEYLLHLF
jgi:hypothetical protein